MPYHGTANGVSGTLLSLKLCQTPVPGIPQMGEKEGGKEGGRRLGRGILTEQMYCRVEKTEFREEFNSSSKRKQFPLGKEETRSVFAT